FFSSIIPRPPRSPLFPYTTLFRSVHRRGALVCGGGHGLPLHAGARGGQPHPVAIAQRHPRSTARVTAELPARARSAADEPQRSRSEEHTSELQSLAYLVCRLLLEK